MSQPYRRGADLPLTYLERMAGMMQRHQTLDFGHHPIPRPSIFQHSMPDKIFDPVFSESQSDVEAYADLVAIVRQLRRDCPWDREQTHESVRQLLIEEAYEVVEAIDNANFDELKVELGDVLLHVLFNAAIAEGDGRFRLRDVIDSLTAKLVRRHPHVFGDVSVTGVDDVLSNWEDIKSREGGTRKSILQGVPVTLPSLLRAFRIQDKVAGVGFDFPNSHQAWEKVVEEIGEFRELVDDEANVIERVRDKQNGLQDDALQYDRLRDDRLQDDTLRDDTLKDDTSSREGSKNADSAARIEEEFGDVLFALVNFARLNGINPEDALRRTNSKFISRFKYIEDQLDTEGISPKAASMDRMDELWNAAKELGL